MDELDSLLNELHQTNQKILQKNNAFNSSSECSNTVTHVTKINEQTESDYTVLDPGQCESGQAISRNGDRSSSSQPDSVQDLNKMLASLDNFDYFHIDQIPQACLGYGQSERGQLHATSNYHTKNPSSSAGVLNKNDQRIGSVIKSLQQLVTSTLTDNHSENNFNTLHSNKQTMLAAKEAERQLDDLLYSLKQFKINNHQSDSGAELVNSMSNSFIDNSISDIHQTNSQTPSHKSSTTSNHKFGTNISTNSINNNSITVDINRSYNYDQHHDNKINQNTDNLNITARLQRHNAKRVISPKYDQINNVSSTEQGPTQLLNSMLNDLSSELSQHGAKTNPRGQCYACKKPINGTLITAIGKEWHPEHFTCASCRVGLVRQDFYERDDQAYCTQCHLQMFSPRCGYCGEAVVEKCVLALARAWHPEHFFCYECHSTFNGSLTVHEQNGKFYCSNCYFTRFGTPCSGCQQPITDAYITALDMPWHKDCFTCRDCNRILTGSSFHEIEGYPYCDSHYYSRRGLLCSACSLPITGRCVNALGKRYHPEHFLCAYCLHPLQTGTFKEHSSKPYCHQCFTQLFG